MLGNAVFFFFFHGGYPDHLTLSGSAHALVRAIAGRGYDKYMHQDLLCQPCDMFVYITYYDKHSRTRGGQEVLTPTLNNHKNIGFLSNTGPDPLKNHKATKPAFTVGLL